MRTEKPASRYLLAILVTLYAAQSWGECVASPIVVDLKGDGLKLGPPGVVVEFDIDGDGLQEGLQWVRPGGDDAFLALDLNGNGVVDDGRELFGSGTILVLEGQIAADGFAALAQYDRLELGGNGDGLITAGDAIWTQLLFWTDRDANGLSSASEIVAVSAKGAVSFRIRPKTVQYWDPAGNYIPLISLAKFFDKPRRRLMADVFFLIP